MPTVSCPRCKKTVRFEGVAGVCPNCASVVRVKAAAEPAGGPQSAPGARSNTSRPRSSKSSGAAPDLTSLADHEPENIVPMAVDYHAHGHGIDKRLLYGLIGGVAFLLLIGLVYVLIPSRPDVPVVVAAPPPPRVAKPVETDVVEKPTQTPEVSTYVPTTQQNIIPVVRPSWAGLKPVRPKLISPKLTDQIVTTSLRSGTKYLKGRFTNSEIRDIINGESFRPGGNALAVYSLMHAGEAIEDNDLTVSSTFMQGLINRLKTFDMTKQWSTYERSLRAQAYSMFARAEDSGLLQNDLKWLLQSEVKGGYAYTMPLLTDEKKMPEEIDWDNSNSQYGVLGVWAASMAGMSVPEKYWIDVENHWIAIQNPDGGWGYKQGNESTITMTCAGVTCLCVAAEQQTLIASKGKKDAHPKLTDAITKGVGWMNKEDNVVTFSNYNGYSLYGVERAALATGFRYFGVHDWYRELGAKQIHDQRPDGSWEGGAGRDVETAFELLFLARGLQPLLVDKLRFDGNWNDRPRDAAKLTQFVSAQLERPFAWGVADLNRDPYEWLESPMLLITTDSDPHFTDDQCHKLRQYADAGGLIFLHNEFASKEVEAFAQALAKRVFPEYPLAKAADDDVIYSANLPMKNRLPMMTVGNGTRTMMVYSPGDLSQAWIKWRNRDVSGKNNPSLQMGLNLFMSAAGKNGFRTRLNTPAIDEPKFEPIGAVPIARIKYDGPWNPEPWAMQRFARYFMNETSVKVDVIDTASKDLSIDKTPIAVLTGNGDADLGRVDAKALHDFVDAGGVLIIDATGGSKAFVAAVNEKLMPAAFPGATPGAVAPQDPFLSGRLACGDPLPKPRLRNFSANLNLGKPPALAALRIGKGTVILSDLDVTTGLLGSDTYAINGYLPEYCQSLIKNVVLWTLTRYP